MFFGGIEFLFFPLALLGVIVLGIVSVVAGRREPDPDGSRSYAVYLVSITFIALFVTLFASFGVLSSLLDLATDGGDPGIVTPTPGFEPFPGGAVDLGPDATDRAISGAVGAAIAALAAGGLLYFHALRLLELVDRPNFERSGARRTFVGYLYFTCFVAALIAVGAAATAAFGIFEIVAPGVAGSERDLGLVKLVSASALAAAGTVIFLYHWNRAEYLRARLGAAPPPPPPGAP
jgi:hypothetical protein